jgi:hypothetical protein
MVLTSECRALGVGAITTYFKRLRFDAAGADKQEVVKQIHTKVNPTMRHAKSKSVLDVLKFQAPEMS